MNRPEWCQHNNCQVKRSQEKQCSGILEGNNKGCIVFFTPEYICDKYLNSNGMKTKKEIEDAIKQLRSDERLSYPTAMVHENAPLALMQLELETRIKTLKWVLL
jgi:hypothetical protein